MNTIPSKNKEVNKYYSNSDSSISFYIIHKGFNYYIAIEYYIAKDEFNLMVLRDEELDSFNEDPDSNWIHSVSYNDLIG